MPADGLAAPVGESPLLGYQPLDEVQAVCQSDDGKGNRCDDAKGHSARRAPPFVDRCFQRVNKDLYTAFGSSLVIPNAQQSSI